VHADTNGGDVRDRVDDPQAWLTALVESSDDAIISVAPDLTITTWNAGAEKLYGYPATEMIGRSGRIIVPPDRAQEEIQLQREVFAGQRVAHFESQRLRKDGTLVDVLVTTFPVFDEHGEIAGVSAIARDITDRKRAERELRDSEARYRAIVDSATDLVVGLSAEGLITALNPAFERVLGYRREDWIGKSPLPLVHPDDIPAAIEALDAALRGELAVPYEGRARTASGDYVVLETTTTTLYRDGQPNGLLSVSRDVTERSRSQQRFAALLEAAPDAMVVADAQGDIELVNRQAETMFGYSREELLGRQVEVLLSENELARHGLLRAEYLRDPGIRRMGSGLDLVLQRKDGTVFPADVALAPLQTETGLVVTIAIRDMTQRRRREIALTREAADSAMELAQLTLRELEVLSLAAEGLTAAAVGSRLIVSTRTVESHLASAYRKLGVNTKDQAVRKFRRLRQAGASAT
jgi:PAS domain S-box-containing protein